MSGVGLRILNQDLEKRWRGSAITVAAVFLMLLLTMAMIRTMDLSFLDMYPDAAKRMMGIPDGASPLTFAYGAILTLMGGISLAGVAVGLGADIIAGDERRRTLASLLSHPVPRWIAAAAKAGALVALMVLASLTMLATTLLANVLLDVNPGQAHLLELCLVIGANALWHGALAFMIGAISGDKGLAAGIAGGLLAIGWLASGLLPMIKGFEDAAQYIPYGWFTEQNAVIDGFHGGYLATELGLALVFLAVGIVTFGRRDLRSIPARSMRERMPAVPKVGKSRPSVGRRPVSLFGIAFGRNLTLVQMMCVVMALFTLMMGPVWEQMAGEVDSMLESIPADLMALMGAGDMSSPAGFMWGEMFGLMAPAAVITLGAVVALGLTDEERSGRLGLTLAQSASRSKVLTSKVATLAGYLVILCAAQGIATWAATLIADFDLDLGNIVGTTAHLFGLGFCIGAIALCVAAATGNGSSALWTAVGLGIVGHFSYSALALNDSTEGWSKVSPFYYYSSAQPLANGWEPGHVAVLVGVGLAAAALAFPLFERRDLRV